MEENHIPIREALKNQGLKQDNLVKTLNKTRQTISRYLDQYERDGTVNDDKAQKEFDRIMALERQRMAMEDDGPRLETIRARKAVLQRTNEENRKELEKLLKEIIRNHPDVPMYDNDDKVVTLETLDLDRMWVNYINNEELVSVLSPSEKTRWEIIGNKDSDTFEQMIRNSRMEETCIMEDLWDATDPRGKPIVYHDTIDYSIPETDEDKKYHFRCDTFCLCHDNSARIYADGLFLPFLADEIGAKVTAVIEVISSDGLVYVGTVELENPNYPLRFVGEIHDLIPGYKYVYSLNITADNCNDEDELEYTLMEGYYGKSHPLK